MLFRSKSFTQIVILGSTNFTPFMQLSAGDRRSVIEDLLDIQVFSAMNVLVKSKLTKCKEEESTLRIQIDAVKGKIELHKKHLDELKKNTKEIIDAKKQEVLENKTELTTLDAEYNQTQSNIDTMLVEISDDETTTKKFSKLNSLEAKIETNISKIETDIEFYNDHSTCPTCDQAINNKEEKVHSCTAKLKELNEGLEKLKVESDAIISRINTIKATQKKIQELDRKSTRLNSSH